MDTKTFTRCLRDLRISRGYAKARHFAEAIGIGENRYTRYERGEAEPNIALIYKFCEILGVQPNELFGFGASAGSSPAGFGEQRVDAFVSASTAPPNREVLAWNLARKFVQMRNREAGDVPRPGIEEQRAIASVFLEIEAAPLRVIAGVLALPVVTRAAVAEQKELADLLMPFLAQIGAAP